MPNQLAKSKRRQSLVEHEAVLAALSQIARCEKTSVMALLREAVRELIRKKARNVDVSALRQVVWSKAPKMPKRFGTAAQLARFKRSQREFDKLLLDLDMARPAEVQQRNSIISPNQPVRILEFEGGHATAR